jgi:glycine/D-amino acid oxidase-like deaminating enzyme
MNSISRNEAIVIGGSLGGLLTAHVLSEHFQRVTILERDAIPDEPTARKGQPHTRHLHGLLATGLETMTRYFPDLPEALAAGGAILQDFAEGMQWYAFGGYRKRFRMGVKAALMSRPFLESLIRERVVARPKPALKAVMLMTEARFCLYFNSYCQII